jgi:tetratricopeptide (TPR) repeat protein
MRSRRAGSGAEGARAAASVGDWDDAFELLMDLDAAGTLDPGEVPLLAEVAYAAGHLDVTIAAWERVHWTCLDAQETLGAAGAAARVAMHLLFDTALMAPVRGWLARAERLLDGQPDSPAHAWFAVVRTYERFLSGDPESAWEWAQRAVAVGSSFEPAAGAIGQVAVARLLLLNGEVDEALAKLEEVGVTATGGGLDPLSTGVVYCELVCALQGAAQYDLAEQWTEAMERWCASNAIGSLHGRCRVHRAEILRLRGQCEQAEVEASAACDELRSHLRRELGWPLTELGTIRMRRGNEAGAEEALLSARQLGWDPQPSLARLLLARGDVSAAAEALRSALDRPVVVPSKERPPNNDLQRAPLWAAQVEIEIANADLDRARAAAGELSQVAERIGSLALRADAELAQGRLRLAEGHADAARDHLSAAVHLWQEVRAPYELAVARHDLAAAHRALGQHREADLEDRTSRALLEQIKNGGSTRTELPPGEPDAPESLNRLVREGDYWTVQYDGRTVRVKDLKGIHYLARLLGDPVREFHVLDLVAAVHPPPPGTQHRSHEDDVSPTFDDAGEILDDQARVAYRRRLEEIDHDIAIARAAGDLGRVQQAEFERDFLVRELSNAFGIGGRSRRAGASSERARVSVTRALRTAIRHLTDHHEPLGQHLNHAIRTGTYCSYEPDPANPPHWRL